MWPTAQLLWPAAAASPWPSRGPWRLGCCQEVSVEGRGLGTTWTCVSIVSEWKSSPGWLRLSREAGFNCTANKSSLLASGPRCGAAQHPAAPEGQRGGRSRATVMNSGAASVEPIKGPFAKLRSAPWRGPWGRLGPVEWGSGSPQPGLSVAAGATCAEIRTKSPCPQPSNRNKNAPANSDINNDGSGKFF